jgi:hypothetical protein
MSIFINNKKILGTEPSVNSGDLGLFAGVDDQFYVKKSDGKIYSLSSITGENFVFIPTNGTPVENGTALTNEYAQAILETPNGLPLSENNRYTILLSPGIYEVSNTILWNTDFIDLACIDGIATLTFPPIQLPITIDTNDTQFSNINISSFPFLESDEFIGWPIINNKSKVLLKNCSGNFNSTDYSQEYTIDRDYLNTTISIRILQNCLSSFGLCLGWNYVNLDPNSINKTQFFWSETTNLFAQSRFDLGAVGDSVWFSESLPSTRAYIETQSLPLSDKYIFMNISNVVGTFSLNDIVTQSGTTGIITDTDGLSYFIAYVATGVFPNGTGTITNTTSGGTADNDGWSQNGNTVFDGNTFGFLGNGNLNYMNITLLTNTLITNYIARATFNLQFDSQMYILYEGANTSFDPIIGATVVTNNLGGTASPLFSTNAGELVIASLSGTWSGSTQIWNDLNTTPVTITDRSQNIIHTLNKTVTNR